MLLFLAALISFFAFSFYFIKSRIDIDRKISMARYHQVASVIDQIIVSTADLSIVERFLRGLGFVVDNDEKMRNALINELQKNRENVTENSVFSATTQLDNNIYILLQNADKTIVYRDKFRSSYRAFYFVMVIGLFILILIFVLVIHSLIPLKRLQKALQRFANGHEFKCNINQHDEIGILADEFNNVIVKINMLSQSRSLFLRLIMHELKTPITKGRIVSEMLIDEKSKDRLILVFNRLQILIDEFAKIEQLASKNLNIEKEEFSLKDLVDQSKKMLLLEPNSDAVVLLNPNDMISADFELFSMALKNLLDNAIKYSTDGKVFIESSNYDILIKNSGSALKKELNEYFQPYFKDPNNPNSNHGFGLGMYIIKNTLDAQGFELNYYHEAGINHFIIRNCIIQKSPK